MAKKKTTTLEKTTNDAPGTMAPVKAKPRRSNVTMTEAQTLTPRPVDLSAWNRAALCDVSARVPATVLGDAILRIHEASEAGNLKASVKMTEILGKGILQQPQTQPLADPFSPEDRVRLSIAIELVTSPEPMTPEELAAIVSLNPRDTKRILDDSRQGTFERHPDRPEAYRITPAGRSWVRDLKRRSYIF